MTLDTASRAKYKTRLAARAEPQGDCLVWTGALTKAGYGRLYVPRSGVGNYTHRLSWILTYGAHPCIPDAVLPGDVHVCHRCDNPPCIRPEHLFLGNPKSNMADREAKGRGAHGPNAPHGPGKHRRYLAAECRNGHPFDTDNSHFSPSGYRRCRTCLRIQRAALYAQRIGRPQTPRKPRAPRPPAGPPDYAARSLRRGVEHSRAKLTEDQVREIRRRADAGEGCMALSREFGIDGTTASSLIRRLTWKHVS